MKKPRQPMSARARSGFTLIELVVGIAISALLVGGVIVTAGAITGTKAKTATAELSGVIRALYDSAALKGRTCRLVFDLPKTKGKESEGGIVHYRAECAEGAITARKDRDAELKDVRSADEKRKRYGDEPERRSFSGSSIEGTPSVEELLAREKDRVEAVAKFSSYSDAEVEDRSFDEAVQVTVWTRHQREPVKEGTAYLYFFPQGFTERAQIEVKQGNNVWTILVAPLTGKISVVPDEVEVPRS